MGLIKGYIPGARERNNPDINWTPVLMMQTRTQTKQAEVSVHVKGIQTIIVY